MRITNYGHSCFGVSSAGRSILFDSFVTGNPLAKSIKVDTIPADLVLISHGHNDHVMDAEAILKRTGATLLSNFEIATWYGRKGVEKTVGMNLGGSTAFGEFRLKYVVALHSSELPDGSYGGNPGGFVVEGPEGAFHHAGDTAVTMDMRLLERHQLKFAFLPIGDHFTMGVKDAVLAAQVMGVKKVIGMHYDTFPPIAIDKVAAQEAFKKDGIELLLPAIGSTIEL